MKKLVFYIFFTATCTLAANAQVQVDKPLELTGTGADAKVSGIKTVSASQDAINVETHQKNSLNYAQATNSGDTIIVNLNPVPTSYPVGMIVHFRASADVTGAASIVVNTLAAKPVKKNFNLDLVANDIKNGQLVSVMYDGTNFQMLSQLGNAGGATSSCPTLAIGASYGGGIVVATNYPGVPCGYLIASTADQSSSSQWGCSGTFIGGLFDGFGYGRNNTTAIAATCATANISAKLCDDLVSGGFSDWFLPNKEELTVLYRYRATIGGFQTSAPPYTSSSQFTANQQFTEDFNNGALNQGGYNKTDNCRVRCVRAF